MFRTPITRPLRWALPLAAAGVVASLLIGFSPVHSKGVSCGAAYAPYARSAGGWFAYEPGTSVTFSPAVNCPTQLARRFWAAQAVGAVLALPLVLFAIRGFLWGANAIARMQAELAALRAGRGP